MQVLVPSHTCCRSHTVQRAAVRQRLEQDALSNSDSDEEDFQENNAHVDPQDEAGAMAGAEALAAVWLAGGSNVRQTLMNGLRSTGVFMVSAPWLGYNTPHVCTNP